MQEEFKYFISYSVEIDEHKLFRNTEINFKLIESIEDIKEIESMLKHDELEVIIILHYRMF